MKKAWCLVIFLLVFSNYRTVAQGFNFHGKVQNSVYAYEDEQKNTRIYQYLQFSAATPNKMIGVNVNLRALTDAEEKLESDQRFKAYALNLVLKNLFNNRLNVVVGRQFLHPGTPLGALDGGNATVQVSSRLRTQIYTGAQSTPSRAFEIEDPKNRFVAGGMLELLRFHATDLQLFYLQKSNQDETYWQISGLNVTSKFFKDTPIRLQVHYNAKAGALHRLLLNLRHEWSEKLSTQFEYKAQQPRVYANSYFTIFETMAFQRVRAAAAWQMSRNYALDGQYQLLLTKGVTAHRILLGVHDRRGSIGFIYESGDLGDQIGLNADYGYEVIKNLIASIYIDYSRYRTETVYEYEQQLANAARISYRLGRHWSAIVEYQWLTNRVKESDSRLLNHISFRW
ncbi:hypothetical protein JXO59_02930 [candidate division KSB1 bacterium]|nr:hypothetical protein [candidate division KSB1 bacterium]